MGLWGGGLLECWLHGHEQAEAEVTGVAEGERAADGLREGEAEAVAHLAGMATGAVLSLPLEGQPTDGFPTKAASGHSDDG